MESFTIMPGQTAPRLARNLNSHDPRSNAPYNPLRDAPPGFAGDSDTPFNNPPTCRHKFTIKADQCLLNSQGPPSKVAAICQNCTWHLDVTLRHSADQSRPVCPSHSFPLHHFVVLDRPMVDPSGSETYTFICTGCDSTIRILYRIPRLSPPYHDLLTEPNILQKRFLDAQKEDPSRPRLEQQPGIKVLEALSSYISDSLHPSLKKNTAIPLHNKRFMTSFGTDCDGLLNWLGFRKTKSDEGHMEWKVPQPPAADPTADQRMPRVILEDVMEELYAKLRKYPHSQLSTIRYGPPPTTPYDDSIRALLGVDDYPKANFRVRKPELEDDDLYAGLGAVQDFANDLLMYAFYRQVDWDPASASYYFDCFSMISSRRMDDDLNIKTATLASEGFVSRAEVAAAYRYLGFQDNVKSATDDQILGSFESRLENSPRSQESELREKLRIIGWARRSAVLCNAAENVIQTEEQALKWLDSTYDGNVPLTDQGIIAMATIKIADRPDQSDVCASAIRVIADARNSADLRAWLSRGSLPYNSADDEIATAYSFFEIHDRSQIPNREVLKSQRDFIVLDYPSREEEANRHYDVIIKHLAQPAEKADYDNPVGLSNMGNTCYLNCLLQYFYAIKPLREMVLNFDDYKIDTSVPLYLEKYVEKEKIPKTQTVKSQHFVDELRALYKQMESAPGPIVNPTWSLATRALEMEPRYVSARRATIDGDAPMSPIRAQPPKTQEAPNPIYASASTNSSEITLIESQTRTPESDDVMVLDEDEDSQRETGLERDPMDPEAMPLLAGSEEPEPPRRLPPVPPRDSNATEPGQVGLNDSPDAQLPKPKPEDASEQKPPPVPARPAVSANQRMIGPLNRPSVETSDEGPSRMKAEAAAQQQDVAEAMDNVLFKLRCSIYNDPPEDGKADDKVKKLFSGEIIWKYINKKLDDSTDIFNTIFVPLAAKPKDITAGLDEEFTLDDIPEWGDGAKRYKTITKLPPVFQIYLQRQDFDHARQDAVVNKHHIQLEEVIYLDRFANPDLHRLREKSWELDSKLKKLRSKITSLESTSIGMPAPDVLDSTWQFISTLGEEVSTDAALGDAVRSQASARRDGIRRLTQALDAREEQKRTLFDGHKQFPYRLAAVFMHRGHGGASGGHYWVYIRDFKSGEWRRYEDREVRAVTDLQEIYGEADPETTGAPYYVVYVREEQTEELVDAVCRIKPEETADTHMEGAEGDVMETVPEEPEDGGSSVPFEPKDEEEAFVPMIS